MAEKTCPRCSMAEKEWKGGNGRGVDKRQTFCCDGCANNTGCNLPLSGLLWGRLTSLGVFRVI